MTFSIVARDKSTGHLGIAVQSKTFAVGTVVPWVLAGKGAIAVQATVNVRHGAQGLSLLDQGLNPRQVLDKLLSTDVGSKIRQIAVVDADGRADSYTGANCLPWAGGVVGDGWACQGNILAGPSVVTAMGEAFCRDNQSFPSRLLAALEAGQRAGGDSRGMQSAAILVIGNNGPHPEGRLVDLRVDDHTDPIAELKRLYAIHQQVWTAWTEEWSDYTGDIVLICDMIMKRLSLPNPQALANSLGVPGGLSDGKIHRNLRVAVLAERLK